MKNKANIYQIIIVVILISLGLFFYFYKLFSNFNLTDDPGRDAVFVYDIVFNRKLTLIGPKASAGGFYYGPLYFYLLIPFYLMTGFDPIAAPILTAITGIITSILIYFLFKKIMGELGATLTTIIYTISPFVINQARRGWNPSLLPLFSLLCLYFGYRYISEKNGKFLLLWGLCFGLGLQFHFALIFSLPIYLIVFIIKNIKNKRFIPNLFLSLTLILIFFLPLLFFELRHNFIITKGFIYFLGNGIDKGKTYHQAFSVRYLLTLLYQSFISTIFVGKLKDILLIIFSALLLLVAYIQKFKNQFFNFLLLIFFGSLVVLSFYKGPIHPYYWIFILPLLFMIAGSLLSYLIRYNKIGIVLGLSLFLLISYEEINRTAIFVKPLRLISQEKEAAKIISSDNPDENVKINIVMFSDIDAIHSAFEYRYLVKYYGRPVLPAEDYKSADKLYIVAERKISNPLLEPVMEIKDFQPKKVEKVWNTKAGYTIYRLGKN